MFLHLIRIALKALMQNRMRGFLTMLGIVIGVAAVIIMLAMGKGAKAYVSDQISGAGSNMIIIMPGSEERGGARMDVSSMQSLKEDVYEKLRTETSYLQAVSPMIHAGGQFINGANNYPASITGVSTDYLSIRNISVSEGDMFTKQEEEAGSKVCVIGKTIRDNLFLDGEDCIGRVIRFNSMPFRIVGVLESKGANSMGQDQDAIVLAPYTTIMKRVRAITYMESIVCSALNEQTTQLAIGEITTIIRHQHRLVEDQKNDFTIHSQEELMNIMDSVLGSLTILLSAIAGISLLVGGIGIMNIMLVSVTERTREIGLRMAVGARGIDVLGQFLVESIVLSITGGLIGVVIGWAVSAGVRNITEWPVGVEWWTILVSFLVCTVTGVFFGWYPARKASQLNPIDALRYE